MISWQTKALTLAWGLVFLAGCASRGPEVKGTVTLDGKPLSKARVTFEPLVQPAGGAVGGAVAICDENGVFNVIPQAEGRTLDPGTYAVTVSRKADAQGNVPKDEDYGQLEAANQLVESVPVKYTTFVRGTSPEVKVDVKDGPNDLKIELKSQ
jgi:hypothetical protein